VEDPVVRQDPGRGTLPYSLRAGVLACTDATLGTVSALFRCYFLATHFDGLSSDFSSLPATSALRSMRKHVDSPVAVCSLQNILPQ